MSEKEGDIEAPPERTTLSVPKHFAEMLRREYDRSNDYERLKEWAGKRQGLGETYAEDAKKLLKANRPSENDKERLDQVYDKLSDMSDVRIAAINHDMSKITLFLTDLDSETKNTQRASRLYRKLKGQDFIE